MTYRVGSIVQRLDNLILDPILVIEHGYDLKTRCYAYQLAVLEKSRLAIFNWTEVVLLFRNIHTLICKATSITL